MLRKISFLFDNVFVSHFCHLPLNFAVTFFAFWHYIFPPPFRVVLLYFLCVDIFVFVSTLHFAAYFFVPHNYRLDKSITVFPPALHTQSSLHANTNLCCFLSNDVRSVSNLKKKLFTISCTKKKQTNKLPLLVRVHSAKRTNSKRWHKTKDIPHCRVRSRCRSMSSIGPIIRRCGTIRFTGRFTSKKICLSVERLSR